MTKKQQAPGDEREERHVEEEALRADPTVQRIIAAAMARYEGLIPAGLEAAVRGTLADQLTSDPYLRGIIDALRARHAPLRSGEQKRGGPGGAEEEEEEEEGKLPGPRRTGSDRGGAA